MIFQHEIQRAVTPIVSLTVFPTVGAVGQSGRLGKCYHKFGDWREGMTINSGRPNQNRQPNCRDKLMVRSAPPQLGRPLRCYHNSQTGATRR